MIDPQNWYYVTELDSVTRFYNNLLALYGCHEGSSGGIQFP